MTREQVDDYIENYRKNVGRISHIDMEIADLGNSIKRERHYMVAEAALAGKKTDINIQAGISKQPETLGIKFADGYVPKDILDMEESLRSLKEEAAEKRRMVKYVDGWMSNLTEKERWIIRRHSIDGESWKSIGIEYKKRYDEERSTETLKRIKRNAMEIIYSIAT